MDPLSCRLKIVLGCAVEGAAAQVSKDVHAEGGGGMFNTAECVTGTMRMM
jgi:hypothetical protein